MTFKELSKQYKSKILSDLNYSYITSSSEPFAYFAPKRMNATGKFNGVEYNIPIISEPMSILFPSNNIIYSNYIMSRGPTLTTSMFSLSEYVIYKKSFTSVTITDQKNIKSVQNINTAGYIDIQYNNNVNAIYATNGYADYINNAFGKANNCKNYTVIPIATNKFPFKLKRIPIYYLYNSDNGGNYLVSIASQELLCYLYPKKSDDIDPTSEEIKTILSCNYNRAMVNGVFAIESFINKDGNTQYTQHLPNYSILDTLTNTKIDKISESNGYFILSLTTVALYPMGDEDVEILSSTEPSSDSDIYISDYTKIDLPEISGDLSDNISVNFDSESYYRGGDLIKLRVHSVNGVNLYDKKLYAYGKYDKNLDKYYITTDLSDSDFFKYIIDNHKIKINGSSVWPDMGTSDYPNIDVHILRSYNSINSLSDNKKYSNVNSIELFGGVSGFPVYYKSGGVFRNTLETTDKLKISFVTYTSTLNIVARTTSGSKGTRDSYGSVFVDTYAMVDGERKWCKNWNAEWLENISDTSMCSYTNDQYMPIGATFTMSNMSDIYARMQLNNVIFIIEDVAEVDYPTSSSDTIGNNTTGEVTNPVNDEILSNSVDDNDYYIGAGNAQTGFSDGSEAVLGDSDLQSYDLFYYRAPNEDTGDVSVKSLKSIIGLPLQFMSHVDSAVTGYGYGKEFTSNIIYDSSICVIKPGTPTGDSGFISTLLSDGLFQGFLNLTSVIGDTANILFGNGNISSEEFVKSFINKIFINDVSRLYVWKSDLEHYIEYVNTLCHMFISYLGIGELNYKDPGTNEDIPYNQYNFLYNLDIFDSARQRKTGKYDTVEIQTDTVYTDQNERRSLSNIFGDDPAVYLYYSADSDIQESFSTSTTASEVMGAGQGLSDISKQITYLTGSTFLGAFDESIGSAIATAVDGTGLKNTPLGRLFGNISEGVGVIIGGNNFDVPEMWSDSDRQISHSLTVKLISPYGDPESIFLYVLQPLAQILAFSLPRQFSVNSYTSPFIIQAFSKGQFNIQFGIVDSLTITRGGNGKESHTIHNIPTELDVTISIKDMYEKVALSNEYLIDDGFFNKVTGGILDLGFRKAATLIFNNIGLLDFCASYCGYNLNTPQGEHISAYLWNMYLNRIRNNIDWGELWNNLKEDGVWGLLNSKNFPGLTKKHIDIYNNTIHKLTTFSTT